jgi:hypothetical protein
MMRGAAARAALAVLLAGCQRDPRPAPVAADAPAPLLGFDCVFEDATERSGVDFVHVNGAFGEKLLPETMGSGACLFDWNQDGNLDLFLVNSGALPGSNVGATARSALYQGNGDGTFADVSRSANAELARYGMGTAAADADGDGDEDLYVTALGENALLWNRPEGFADGTRAAGVGGGTWTDAAGIEQRSWSTAALWLDADVDGDLDLFVGGYVQWTRALEVFTSLDGVRKSFTTPDRYAGLPSHLYRNAGSGSFAEIPAEDLDCPLGKVLGAAMHDFDADGLPEIAIANDKRPNSLLWNLGNARFLDRAGELGVAYDADGRARAGMGIDVVELEGLAGPWIAIGNFADEPASLYRVSPDGALDWSQRSGIAPRTNVPLTFGLAFLDADLDGRQDLFLANGHIEPSIALFRPAQRYLQPALLFRGLGDGSFADVSAADALATPRVARGLAAGDLDGDGDLDVVLTQNGARAHVLANRAQETRSRRFLRVVLHGPQGNPRALGAVVRLQAGGARQERTLRTGSSYLSQNEVSAHFGLGNAAAIESLEVRWPGAGWVSYPPPALDTTVELSAP